MQWAAIFHKRHVRMLRGIEHRPGRDREAGCDHGFADVSHTLEIFGTCAACRAAEPAQTKSQTFPSACTYFL